MAVTPHTGAAEATVTKMAEAKKVVTHTHTKKKKQNRELDQTVLEKHEKRAVKAKQTLEIMKDLHRLFFFLSAYFRTTSF